MDDYNKFLTMLEKEDKDSAFVYPNLLDSKKYDYTQSIKIFRKISYRFWVWTK
jgi:hypothetical protein